MKKSTIFLITLLLIVSSFFLLFYFKKVGINRDTQNSTALLPVTNLQFWTGTHEIVLYLDYSQTGTLNFLRIFTPSLRTIAESQLVRLQFRNISWSDNSLILALYCSYSFGKYFEFSKWFVENNIQPPAQVSYMNLMKIASWVGIDSWAFSNCFKNKLYLSSVYKDEEMIKNIKIKRFPTIYLDGKIFELSNITPQSLIELVYKQYWYQESWRQLRIPPPGWWHREDGQPWEVDESVLRAQ